VYSGNYPLQIENALEKRGIWKGLDRQAIAQKMKGQSLEKLMDFQRSTKDVQQLKIVNQNCKSIQAKLIQHGKEL
jgi:hypothetical protein